MDGFGTRLEGFLDRVLVSSLGRDRSPVYRHRSILLVSQYYDNRRTKKVWQRLPTAQAQTRMCDRAGDGDSKVVLAGKGLGARDVMRLKPSFLCI